VYYQNTHTLQNLQTDTHAHTLQTVPFRVKNVTVRCFSGGWYGGDKEEKKKGMKEEDAKEIVFAEFQETVPLAVYKHNILKFPLTDFRHTMNSGIELSSP